MVVTTHANIRMKQRGVRLSDLEFAQLFGVRYYLQGLICYCVTARCLRDIPDSERLRNLVVWMTHEGEVITVYKHSGASLKLKKSTKIDLKKRAPVIH